MNEERSNHRQVRSSIEAFPARRTTPPPHRLIGSERSITSRCPSSSQHYRSGEQRRPRCSAAPLVEVHVHEVLPVPESGAPGVPLLLGLPLLLAPLVVAALVALERRLWVLHEGLEAGALLAPRVQGDLPGRNRDALSGTHVSHSSLVRAGGLIRHRLGDAVERCAQLRMVVLKWPSQKAVNPRRLVGANSQGTWCSCVRTCSSSTLPLLPRRLPRRVRIVSSSWSMTAKTTAWLRIRTSVGFVRSVRATGGLKDGLKRCRGRLTVSPCKRRCAACFASEAR